MLKRIVLLYLAFCVAFAPVFAFANASGGTWSQSDVIRNGATSVYNGFKKVGEQAWKGVSSFTPNVKQVAKQIGKVGAVGAVTTAIDMLLGGVDYVLDPANNSVVYKPKDTECNDGSNACVNPYIYEIMIDVSYKKFNSIEDACNAFFERDFIHRNWVKQAINDGAKLSIQGSQCGLIYPDGRFAPSAGANKVANPAYDETKTKRISYDVVAQQIINNANARDDTAVQFVADVADANVTQADKEKDWENTKAPAVPTTGTDTANPAKDGTGTKDDTNTANPPDTANPDKPNDKPFELPTFCGWAKTVCDFVEWAKSEPQTKDEPTKIETTDIDIGDWQGKVNATYVRGSSACPADVSIPIQWMSMRSEIKLSYKPFCHFATMIKPAVIMGAWISGLMIVTGGRTKE